MPDQQVPPEKQSKEVVKPMNAVPSGEKILAILGYISFFCVLPLAIKPNSAFCQHHGKQGLVLTLLFWVMGAFAMIPALVVMIGVIKVIIIAFCMIRVSQGSSFKLPLVSNMTAKLNW